MMERPLLKYLPGHIASKAIALFFILVVALFLSTRSLMPLQWILFGVVEMYIFFHFSTKLSIRWVNVPEPMLTRKIFQTGLAIRMVYVIFIYLFYLLMTGVPYEFAAADSLGYQEESEWLLSLIGSGNLNYYFTVYLQKGISDSGFPLFLALVYGLMGGTVILIVPRLLYALLGAYMSVVIYRLANRNFGTDVARLAAILTMLSPTLVYYCGIPLKETLMVFILVLFVERADLLFRNQKLDAWLFAVVCLTGVSLFLFRTVLGGAAWLSMFINLLFTKTRFVGFGKRVILVFWLGIASIMFLSGTILHEAENYLVQSESNQSSQMKNYATREGGNKLATYGSKIIFIPLILPAPFPSLVNASNLNSMMICGATYTRNIYVFFVLLALIILYKEKLIRKYIFILSVLFSYLLILDRKSTRLNSSH